MHRSVSGWWGTNDLNQRITEGQVFNPGEGWHVYRVEAKGNTITLLIDGTIVAKATDNRYLSGSRTGLWSNEYQLEIRSSKVVAL